MGSMGLVRLLGRGEVGVLIVGFLGGGVIGKCAWRDLETKAGMIDCSSCVSFMMIWFLPIIDVFIVLGFYRTRRRDSL